MDEPIIAIVVEDSNEIRILSPPKTASSIGSSPDASPPKLVPLPSHSSMELWDGLDVTKKYEGDSDIGEEGFYEGDVSSFNPDAMEKRSSTSSSTAPGTSSSTGAHSGTTTDVETESLGTVIGQSTSSNESEMVETELEGVKTKYPISSCYYGEALRVGKQMWDANRFGMYRRFLNGRLTMAPVTLVWWIVEAFAIIMEITLLLEYEKYYKGGLIVSVGLTIILVLSSIRAFFNCDHVVFKASFSEAVRSSRQAFLLQPPTSPIRTQRFPLGPVVPDYCHDCQCFRRPEFFHCKECDVCVRGSDYHCDIVGFCVPSEQSLGFNCMIMSIASLHFLLFCSMFVEFYNRADSKPTLWYNHSWLFTETCLDAALIIMVISYQALMIQYYRLIDRRGMNRRTGPIASGNVV